MRVWIEALLVYAASWAYLARLQFLTPYMPGTDGYYHTKLAWLLRTRGLFHDFPWATQSMWAERFYDNALGFHVLMIPFTGGDLVVGAKLGAVSFGAALIASFYAFLRLRRTPFAPLFTLLLIATGGYFIWRLSLPRPHLLALVLSLWGLYFLLARRALGVAVVGVVYSLSYLAPILPFYAGVHAGACLLTREPFPWRNLAAAFGGVLLGWVLHPHFLGNFQGGLPVAIALPAQVLISAWGVSGPDLGIGGEGGAIDTRVFLVEHFVILAAALVTVFALSRVRIRLDAARVTLAAVALTFFVGACLTVRFIEYFVPMSLLACAELAGAAWREAGLTLSLRDRRARLAAAALGVFVAGALVVGDRASQRYLLHPHPPKRRFAAEWLREHSPPGAIVFTCDWDDAPELFFFDHANRYLVFLDPMYLYAWKPERWAAWQRVARGEDPDPVATLRETFGARYGFCTSGYEALRQQLARDRRARIRLAGPNGYLFELTPGGSSPDAGG